MRYLLLELKGFIGIYNGLGRDIITIDFKKCKHNKIIIRGDNGSGKSTILNALSPLTDNVKSMMPNIDAYKKLILENNGIIYDINIIYPVSIKTGERMQTRGYISRTIGDETIELNSNGNITSYRLNLV